MARSHRFYCWHCSLICAVARVKQTLLEELGSPLDGHTAMHATNGCHKTGQGGSWRHRRRREFSSLFASIEVQPGEFNLAHNHHNHSHPRNPDPAIMRAFLLLGLAAAATAMPEITSDGNTVSLMAPDGDVMVR
jgi:hypothetical protein